MRSICRGISNNGLPARFSFIDGCQRVFSGHLCKDMVNPISSWFIRCNDVVRRRGFTTFCDNFIEEPTLLVCYMLIGLAWSACFVAKLFWLCDVNGVGNLAEVNSNNRGLAIHDQ